MILRIFQESDRPFSYLPLEARDVFDRILTNEANSLRFVLDEHLFYKIAAYTLNFPTMSFN